MLLRSWQLDRLFEQEAEGAGEGSSSATAVVSDAPAETVAETTETPSEPEPGQPDHAANVAFVKEWAKTADADTVSATITTTEPIKETPVVESTTDAVSDADDAVTSSGNGQDELLLELAEAYDFTREELKGISNEGLTSLIAREKRRQAAEAKPEETPTTTATEQTETAAGGTQTVTFEQLAQVIRDDMTEQGHDETAIERRLSLEKLNWDRQEALLNDARQAREETQWVRSQFAQERQQQFEAAERQGFFDIVAKVATTEKGLLPLPGETNAAPEKVENLNKWWQAFNDVKRVRRDVQELAKTNLPAARAKAANIAFTIAFPEVVAKRGQLAYAKKQLAQADKVMGSPRSAKAPDSGSFNGNPWDAPNIVRHWNKMQANKS